MRRSRAIPPPPKPELPPTPPQAPLAPSNLSVVILTHDAYLHWLPEVLASVHRQRPAIREVILVVDSAKATLPELRWSSDITVLKRKFASPNDARNAGLAHVKTAWVCYVDGDNIPDAGYFEQMRRLADQAPADVAILYPDLKRVGQDGSVNHMLMPEWDYWACRGRSIVDTCSAWRVKALNHAGGWFTPAECLQDYATALKITQQGWKAMKARGLTATLRDHDGNLSKRVDGIPNVLWNSRRLAVVTLFAGRRHCLTRLMDWYLNEEFPSDTHLVWIDDSNDPEFHRDLWSYGKTLQAAVASIQIWKNPQGGKDLSSFLSLHDHVAKMYNRVFSSVVADIYLTVEDDVIAPVGSVRRILGSRALWPFSRWGGVCAIYPSRNSKDKSYMSASPDKDRWVKCPIAGFPAEIVEMGYTGAGFAVWSGAALQKALPLHSSVAPSGYQYGWDGTLCRRLAQAGYKVGIDGRVCCEHLCE